MDSRTARARRRRRRAGMRSPPWRDRMVCRRKSTAAQTRDRDRRLRRPRDPALRSMTRLSFVAIISRNFSAIAASLPWRLFAIGTCSRSAPVAGFVSGAAAGAVGAAAGAVGLVSDGRRVGVLRRQDHGRLGGCSTDRGQSHGCGRKVAKEPSAHKTLSPCRRAIHRRIERAIINAESYKFVPVYQPLDGKAPAPGSQVLTVA